MSLSQVSSTSKKVKFKSWIWFIAALPLSERARLLLPNWGWGVLFLGFQGEWEARAHGEGKGEGPALGCQLLAEFQELKYQSKITCTHTSYSWWSYWWWSWGPKLVWPSWFQLIWTKTELLGAVEDASYLLGSLTYLREPIVSKASWMDDSKHSRSFR